MTKLAMPETSPQPQPVTNEMPRRILYSDDMQALRDVIRLTLGKDGHKVECVDDGSIALQRVQSQPDYYELVITDHHMPVMDGLELVQRLRDLDYPGKIVIFSSELSERVTSAYRTLDVDCILMKPIFMPKLRQVLRELWDK